MLQHKADLPRPECDEEWVDRTSIDVHQNTINDTLREMKKPRFAILKLLEV